MIQLPVKRSATTRLPRDEQAIVMASRLELRRYRDVPSFLVSALRLRRRFGRTDGSIQLVLAAKPLRRTFFTVSAWTDSASLDGYAGTEEHVKVMLRFGSRLADSTFESWPLAAGERAPTVNAALSRLG